TRSPAVATTWSSTPGSSRGELVDLDTLDEGVVGAAVDELDRVISGGVGVDGELLDVGLPLSACRCEDVVLRQDLSPVDLHGELSLTSGRLAVLAEVQADRMAGTRGEAGDRVREVVESA